MSRITTEDILLHSLWRKYSTQFGIHCTSDNKSFFQFFWIIEMLIIEGNVQTLFQWIADVIQKECAQRNHLSLEVVDNWHLDKRKAENGGRDQR